MTDRSRCCYGRCRQLANRVMHLVWDWQTALRRLPEISESLLQWRLAVRTTAHRYRHILAV